MIVTNPPYGERIGHGEALPQLWSTVGDVLKQRFGGWTAFLLAGDRQLANQVGLKASRRIPLFNGPLECRLLRYDLWDGRRT